MSNIAMTYGTLPTIDQYQAAFQKNVPGGIYRIRNCRILDAIYENGNVDLDSDQLWLMLNDCTASWQSNHEAEELASNIMMGLGFEWV